MSAVSPLLMHWRYCSHVLSHQNCLWICPFMYMQKSIYSKVPLKHSPVRHIFKCSTAVTTRENKIFLELTKDIPYLALMGEIWDVYSGYFWENLILSWHLLYTSRYYLATCPSTVIPPCDKHNSSNYTHKLILSLTMDMGIKWWREIFDKTCPSILCISRKRQRATHIKRV